MRPVACMITDRRRIVPDGDGPAAARPPEAAIDLLVRRVAAAAQAGVHLVQVRERDLDGGPLLALVRACLDATRGTRARVLVNDRLDVALAAGAHGVHLRADSMPAARVRACVPKGFLVGRSVHSVAEAVSAEAAGGLDYLLFGPVFATASKPGMTPAGVQALAAVVAAVRIPVLAVGGASADVAGAIARTGAAGFAAIGLFADGREAGVSPALGAACAAFDTSPAVP